MSEKIVMKNGNLSVPNNPIIPYIEGDGIGPDIWAAAEKVINAAVKKAYKEERKIEWIEVLAGKKAFDKTGSWLPKETEEAFKEYLVGIKGPLTTPVGGGIRSLNVALRQKLDLYVCLRPVKYYRGITSFVVYPDLVNMVVFRENTEDVYAGLEAESGSKEAAKIINFFKNEMGWDIRTDSGIGIKPISKFGSQRLVRAAIKYAIDNKRKSVTLVHKGNIMKYTEGAFCEWGYQLAKSEYGDKVVSWNECGGQPPKDKILIKDVIADAFLQQILTRPNEYDVVATMNLNGDYISDALAAQVGGIGIAPGANINYITGTALFEATHGTAPKYAGMNKVNPSSIILSGKMMLEYMGWNKAANLIENGISTSISKKIVTYDLARLMDRPKEVSTTGFSDAIIDNMC